MAQRIKVKNRESNTDYVFTNETDNTTISINDESFALIMALDNLTNAVNNLALATRTK